jgi:protein-tyrosine phosphatase
LRLTEIIAGSLYQSDADPEACATVIDRGARNVVLIDLCGLRTDQIPLRDDVLYVRWPIEDGPVPDRSVLLGIERFGASVVEGGGTVIAMFNMGRNRSGLVAALIVARVRALRGREALDYVRSKNAEAVWNEEFARYLEER